MHTLIESCFKKDKYIRIPTNTAKELFYYTEWSGKFECKDDFYIFRNNFDSYLIIYTLSGSGILNYNNNSYTADKGSVIFLDCNNNHAYYTKNEPWVFKYIHINGIMLKKYYDYIVSLYGAPVFDCKLPEFENMLDRIISDTKNHNDESESSQHIYKAITSMIYSYNYTQDVFNAQKIMDYISNNYMDDIDVHSIAKKFNFSRSYFTVQFKKKTGISPHNYLTQCRISAAKQMLANTNYHIHQIADSCGFTSCSAFIRTFKNKVGLSPLAYKKSLY